MTFATYEKNGRIATITLNRPESRNAIATQQDCDDLAGAFWRANDDADINAVIVTGAGKSFCAGGDLKAIRERTGIGPRPTPDGTRANYRRGVHSIIRALADVEVATIAAINGHAIGLGLDIGILCDMRLAGASAKMASSFVKVGIIPGDGGAWFMQRLIGYQQAFELTLSGRIVGADEAKTLGIALEVVEPGQLLPRAHEMAARFAAQPPKALRLTKRLMKMAQRMELKDFLDLCAAFQGMCHNEPEHLAAVNRLLARS